MNMRPENRIEADKRVNFFILGPGVHPSPIENPPKQNMRWDCINCLQKFETFETYIEHKCPNHDRKMKDNMWGSGVFLVPATLAIMGGLFIQ